MTTIEKDYRLVYASMGAGHEQDRKYLADKYGVPVNNLADLNALGLMLFSRLSPSQKEADLKDTEDQLNKAASLLGKKGGSAKSDAKTASSRANGKKGGRPRQIMVYAHRSNEERGDCLTAFTRRAWYALGEGLNGKYRAHVTTNPASSGMGTRPCTLRIIASKSCVDHYSMCDFCELAESVIEANPKKY